MKRCNIITTGVLALALALPVSGCFGLGNTESDNFTDSLLDMAEDATKIAEDLQDVEWGKLSRAVVRNAATGDVVAEITDQPTIEAAFEPLSKVNGIAPKPEEPEEPIESVDNTPAATPEPEEEGDEIIVDPYADCTLVCRTVCNTCGADITNNGVEHGKWHMIERDENFSYRDQYGYKFPDGHIEWFG